ncbi:MAG: DUF6452 family protein [Bacteroidota bacterium]
MILKFIAHNPWLIITIALCAAVIGCKDLEDCRTDYTSLVSIDFQKTTDFDAIEIVGGIKFTSVPSYRVFPLPLNPSADSTTFLFYKSSSTTADTLAIFYKRAPSLISPQCGVQQAYTLDSLQTTFAKASIIHASLRKSIPGPHVQISY